MKKGYRHSDPARQKMKAASRRRQRERYEANPVHEVVSISHHEKPLGPFSRQPAPHKGEPRGPRWYADSYWYANRKPSRLRTHVADPFFTQDTPTPVQVSPARAIPTLPGIKFLEREIKC